MKTMFSLIIITFMVSSAFSNPTIPPLDEMLQKEICYPDQAKQINEEGIVLVSFTINEEGKAEIIETNSSSKTLEEYVILKLKSLNFLGFLTENELHNVKFDFHLL